MGSRPAAGDPHGSGVDNPVVNPGRQAGGGAACNDKLSQWAVGQPPEDGVLQRIRRESGAAELRVLPEGAMVTREYRDDRVNVHLDASGRVSAIICG